MRRLTPLLAVAVLASASFADIPTTKPATLRDQLRDEMSGNQQWGWDQAKRLIYNDVDWEDDTVDCVYGGGRVRLQGPRGQQRQVNNGGMSIEHSWPRSANWGDGVGKDTPEESDLHHLFPTRVGLNGARANFRFGTPTPETAEELRVKQNGYLAKANEAGLPTGSRLGKDTLGQDVFEPPDRMKGDLARASFYVTVRYGKAIPDDMEATLRTWDKADLVDDAERTRDAKIKDLQGSGNVFIERPELAGEIGDF